MGDRIALVQGDITKQAVDSTNAAELSLLGGGGSVLRQRLSIGAVELAVITLQARAEVVSDLGHST
jgi:hypothetical protein